MSKRRCSECRNGEHENYDDKVRLVVIRDPDTNKISKRAYMCATHIGMYEDDGYDIYYQN